MGKEKAVKWSRTQIEVLIDTYKEEVNLYSPKHPLYRNKRARQRSIAKIINMLECEFTNITEKEVTSKIHNLRNQFNQEKRKVNVSKHNGTRTDDIYIPSLWFYEKMSFLDEFFVPRKSKSADTNQDNKSFIKEIHENTYEDYFLSSSTSTVSPGAGSTSAGPPRKKNKDKDLIIAQGETAKAVQAPIIMPEEDEFHHFGMMIAATVRKFRSKELVGQTMGELSSILFKAFAKDQSPN